MAVGPGILLSYAVSKLLDLVVQEAQKVLHFRKECRELADDLRLIKPSVEDSERARVEHGAAASGSHATTAMDEWLHGLSQLLQEAKEMVEECNRVRTWQVLAKRQMADKIADVRSRISKFVMTAGIVNGRVVRATYELEVENGSMIRATHTAVAQLSERLNVGQTTRQCFQAGQMSPEQATSQIKRTAMAYATAAHHDGTELVPGGANVTSNLVPVADFVVGMEEPMASLRRMLLDPDPESGSGKWVGVWGKGGLGKTLLAARTYNSAEVQRRFGGGGLFWVTVARTPVVKLQRQLLQDVVGTTAYPSEKEDGKQKLYNALQGQTVLLVLDDVWEYHVLEWLDVTSGPGSRILVTTRDQQLLLRKGQANLTMDCLSDNDSWKLFCHETFGGEEKLQQFAPDSLRGLVRAVMGECKGLPLALKVIAGALAGQKREDQWERAVRKLEDAQSLSKDHEQELFKRLQLSYDSLNEIDPRLQDCFLYFAAFPEDRVVDADYLLDLWAGEKLLENDSRTGDTEPDGYTLLGLLIGRSLIDLRTQTWSDKRNSIVLKCQIHDVLRDLARHLLQDGKLPPKREALYEAGRKLVDFPAEWTTHEPTRGARIRQALKLEQKKQLVATRLSLDSNSIKTLPDKLRAPKLRVLLLAHNDVLTFIPPGFIKGFTQLRVMDLSRTGIQTLPASVGDLSSLMHLNLSFNGLLRKLPATLFNLKSLEFLSLQGCSKLDVQLPFTKLRSLKSLNLRGCTNFSESHKSAGHRGSRVDQLKSLDSLAGLRNLWIGSSDHQTIPSSFSALIDLRLLSLYFSRLVALPLELRDGFQAKLEVLELNACVALPSLPPWLDSMKRLRVLDLRMCSRLEALPTLHALPLLEKLDLSLCSRLKQLPEGFTSRGAFPSLKELVLQGCSGLESFPDVEEGAFPRLTDLVLADCEALAALPVSLHLLPSLSLLDLSGCNQIKNVDEWEDGQVMLKTLRELHLRGMLWPHIPKSLAAFPALKKLDLKHCQAKVPTELLDLQSVGRLTILCR